MELSDERKKKTRPRNKSLSTEIRNSMKIYNNKLDTGKEGNISWNMEQKILECITKKFWDKEYKREVKSQGG